tara:strand:+ start:576 stop:1055 length:480 start_codon:yes stop_codon:yes gene_type:complete
MDTEQDKKEQVKAEKGSDKGPSKEPKQDDSPKSAGKQDGKADAKKSSIKTQEKDPKPDRKSADFHPDYHEIEVTMTDGETFKTRSTWGKKGDNLRLEVDPKTHPAWTGGKAQIIDTEGRVERFNRRFKGLGTSKTLTKSQDKEKETDNKQNPPSPDSKK